MKIIRVDIDETICTTPPSRDYRESQPIQGNIDLINRLYDSGKYAIIYWTARGSLTKKDHFALTERQLKEWGARYHTLELGKPFYDIFIDDRSMNIESFRLLKDMLDFPQHNNNQYNLIGLFGCNEIGDNEAIFQKI
jgi:hypothetical protein